MDRRFSRASIPMSGDRYALVRVRHGRHGSPVFPRIDTHEGRSVRDSPCPAWASWIAGFPALRYPCVVIGARWFVSGMGVMDRRFSRAPLPMSGDRCALVRVRQRGTSVYDRLASVFQDEGGPTPAFSGAAGRRVNRHGHRHATTHKNRAQPRGRASGVTCTQCWAAIKKTMKVSRNYICRFNLYQIANKKLTIVP